jgi:hypothetical protein
VRREDAQIGHCLCGVEKKSLKALASRAGMAHVCAATQTISLQGGRLELNPLHSYGGQVYHLAFHETRARAGRLGFCGAHTHRR